MARSESLLLVLCAAGTVAGSLLPGGGHHHGAGNHNSVDHSGGVFTKPGEPLQPFAPQRPPAPPAGRLPQLYFPPPAQGGAEIAIEPADEFTPLSSGPPVGIGDSSVPNFVQPDFGGWIPMTSSPEHQSASQTGGENFSSASSSISQQPTDAGFSQGSSSFGQQSQLQSQLGGGDSGFSSSASGSSSSSTQEELLTNAWSQAPTAQSGGGQGSLPASYVLPSSGSGSSSSQGGSVSTDLKPLNLPTPVGSSSHSSPQSFGGNTGTFSSSLSSPTEVGNSFSEVQSIPTDLKPLGLPQVEDVPFQFLSPNEGDHTGPTFSSNVQSSSGGGASFSQASVTEGESYQVPTQSGSGDINLPSSYVPPASQGGGSFSQGSQVPTDLKPLNLPQLGGFSQPSVQTGSGNNLLWSSGGDDIVSQEVPGPTALKPLGFPQPESLPSQFTSQTSGGGSTSLPSSYVPPSSGNIGSFAQGGGPVPTNLKPINLPQTEGFSQPAVQTEGADNGSSFSSSFETSSNFGGSSVQQGLVSAGLKPLNLPQTGGFSSLSSSQSFGENTVGSPSTFGSSSSEGGGSFTQSQQPIPTILKPLNIPQTGEQYVQTFLKPLDLPQTEPVQPFLKPLEFPQTEPVQAFLKPLDLPQTEPVQTFLKPLDRPQTEPVQTFLKPLDLPQTEPVQTFLKPLDLPQTEPSQTFLKPLDFPQTETVQTFLKPLDLPQAEPVQTFLKPLDLPQTEPVQTFLKPLDLPEIETVETFLKPLDLPQTEPVQTFLKPLDLPQIEPVQTFLKPLDLPQTEPVQTFLKPLDLPQTEPFQTFLKPLNLPQTEPVQTFLKPLNLPQIEPVQTFLKPLDLSQTGEPSVPTILKPLDIPQTGGPPSQQAFQTDAEPLAPSYVPPPSGGGDSFSQGGPVPTELKPLGLPQTSEVTFQSSSQTFVENNVEGKPPVPTLLKPLGLPQTEQPSSPQLESQTVGVDFGAPSPPYQPLSLSGGNSLPQSGSVPAELKPLGLPRPGGIAPQSSFQTGGEGTSYSPSSSSLPSSGGENTFSQGETSVPVLLKPIDLPPQTSGPSSQFASQPTGGEIIGPSSSFVSSSTGVDSSFSQGSVITGGSSSLTVQQGFSANSAPSPPSYVSPPSEEGNSFTEGASASPSIVPTLLKPLGLPPTEGSSSGSSTQFSTVGTSSSYNPSTSSGGQAAAEPIGSSALPPGDSLAAGGVPTLLKPFGLPPQSAVEPDQNFAQAGFQPAETVGINRPSSAVTPEYVNNKPLFPVQATVDNEAVSSGGVLQGGSIEESGSTNSQFFPVSEGTPIQLGPSGQATVSASAVTGGDSAPSSPQTSEPSYQPEIALGAAASGGVGSSVPFPRPPVENKPLGLTRPSLVSGLSGSGGSAGFGSPPSFVIDEQFLTGPSGGPSAVIAPGIPVGVSGGGSGGGFGGGSSGGGGGSNGFNGGSGSGISAISGSGGGSSSGISGGNGVGISSGLDSGLASISSIASNGSGGGGSGGPVEILSQTFKLDENGNYEYSYEQSDGQAAQESGQFTPGNEPETGSLASTGGYRYRSTDGRQYAVKYTADERGFLPTGDHLPTPPAQIAAYAELRKRHPALFWAEKLRVRNPEE